MGYKTGLSYGPNEYGGGLGPDSFLNTGYCINLNEGYGGIRQGDSGGPVYIIENGRCVLVGLVSYGDDERVEIDQDTEEHITYYDTAFACVIGYALEDLEAEIYTG